MSEYLPGTFEPVGAPVVNLFTNPNFVAGSGTVEVQRNYAISSTGASTAADWRGTGNSTGRAISVVPGAGPGGRDCWQFESGASGGGWFQKPAVDGMAVTPGQVVSLSVALRGVAGSTIEVNITGVQSGSEAILVTKNVKITDSWARYAWEGYTVPANVSYVALGIRSASPSTFPLTWFVGDIQYEPSPTARSFIYGGGGFPDPDLTASWAGTPNASPSILTGVRAAGTDVGWQSSQWAASRTRSLYVPAGSVQEFTLTDQTLIVTPRAGSQTVLVNDAPTTAGVEFRHQGTGIVGLGEGWWDNLAIIQGAYDGPNFDGSTPDTDQWVHAWQGTPDASPSTRQEMEAVMATVYGTLTDFGLQSLAPFRPVLKFLPSGPGLKGQRLFTSTPVTATVNPSGYFAVLLEPTDGVTPEVWYTVSIEYLNDGGQYTSLDILGYRLHVPAPGGAIGDLPGKPLTADTVLVGLTPPPPGYKGWWLYSPAEGEEMPADETGIGDLRMVA